MLFSILTAVFRPVHDHLRECLASVDRQSCVDFEHVVVDDGSADHAVHEVLSQSTSRFRTVHLRPTNGGIVAASNDALDRATGEWLVLLDHDDVLADHALTSLARAIDAYPTADVIYSDHDIIRPDGRLAEPAYKPDFSPERLRQTNYVTHLVAIRRSALLEVGGFRAGTDGAQDHDLLLRLMERGTPFAHVPEVLLHWRQSPASVATDTANKPEAFDRGRDVVAAHLERSGIDAEVAVGDHAGIYRIRRRRDHDQLVSVVIPTRGSHGAVWGADRVFVESAVASIASRSTHRAIEFVIVADGATPPSVVSRLMALADSSQLVLRVVMFDESFNFSRKINLGVAAAAGEVVLLLNDDTELIEPAGIATMLSLLGSSQSGEPTPFGEVGVVGAKLLYSDGTLQHGGHVYHGEFMHACIGWRGDNPGPQRMFAIERECAGVTAAALMTTRDVFDRAGRFPEDLPLHFNDVDFCVSVRELGHRILFTPHASWYHFEGKTRVRGATMDEWNRVANRWADGVPHDPYSNSNLTPKRADWLELPGRSGAPPYYFDEGGTKRWC
jgi:GT2 family glycosyltransferase